MSGRRSRHIIERARNSCQSRDRHSRIDSALAKIDPRLVILKLLKMHRASQSERKSNGPSACIKHVVGRAPTRSASSGEWEGRGPFTGWHGSLPPASEREAGWMTPGSVSPRPNHWNATLGVPDPKRGPLFYLRIACIFLEFSPGPPSSANRYSRSARLIYVNPRDNFSRKCSAHRHDVYSGTW